MQGYCPYQFHKKQIHTLYRKRDCDNNREKFESEQLRFKKIVYFGRVIRQGVAARGISKEQFKKDHPNTGIGRRMPGVNGTQTKA